jgi:hypothetical protein
MVNVFPQPGRKVDAEIIGQLLDVFRPFAQWW